MNVKELRERLELIDGECEVLVISNKMFSYTVQSAELDPYFDYQVNNGKSPLCITIND